MFNLLIFKLKAYSLSVRDLLGKNYSGFCSLMKVSLMLIHELRTIFVTPNWLNSTSYSLTVYGQLGWWGYASLGQIGCNTLIKALIQQGGDPYSQTAFWPGYSSNTDILMGRSASEISFFWRSVGRCWTTADLCLILVIICDMMFWRSYLNSAPAASCVNLFSIFEPYYLQK